MERIRAVVEEIGFSGVVRADLGTETRLAEAYGLAHRGHGIPNTVDTRFPIASGTKGFTALTVLRLVEEGTLSLDTTARSVLGEDLPLIAPDVTVAQLLSHRSGIGDYFDEDTEPDPEGYPSPVPVQHLGTTEQYLRAVDGYPTKFPAGEKFSYNNGAFVVLGIIAERAAGVSYYDLVRQLVCEPAGMGDTAFLRSDELPGRTAVGYIDEELVRTNQFHLPIRGHGDGGIYSTVEDIHSLWHALFLGRIVEESTLAEMTRDHSHGQAKPMDYGLGFWLKDSQVALLGGDSGVGFQSWHDPSKGQTATVIGNTGRGTMRLAATIESVLFGQ